MLCPRCNHPLRADAKFCNNCGLSLPGGAGAASAAPPARPAALEVAPPAPVGAAEPIAAAPPERPAEDGAPGKAAPTGPLFREAPPTPLPDLASAAGEAGSAGQPADQMSSNEMPPPPPAEEEDMELPPPPPPGAPGANDQPGTPATPTPSEALYGMNPYTPVGGQPAAAPGGQQPVDEETTIRIPRPGSEVAVTPELLATLDEYEPLAPGMVLKERYRVEEVVLATVEENSYRISDKLGYLHCWACGAVYPENRDPERFCSNCGADMLSKDYRLREHIHTGENTQPDLSFALSPGEAAAEAGEPGQQVAEPSAAQSANGAQPESVDTEEPPPAPQVHTAADGEELDWPTQPMTALDSFIIGPRHYHVEAFEAETQVFPVGVTLVAGARSDVGLTRRGNPNEDSILVMQMSRIHESIAQPIGLYIVADGLGGHDDGQAASRKAIGVIAEQITREVLLPGIASESFGDSETIATKLKAAIAAANLALVESNEKTHSDMGSTVTGALVIGDTAYVINVGDSRTYLYDTASLQPISTDHSLVMQLVIGGLIERDDIYTHPQRNQILRSLGDRRDLQIDLFVQKLRPNYQLVICCDGLWEMIRDPQIEQILREAGDPQTAADRLMETANANGGEDNISVIVVQARE